MHSNIARQTQTGPTNPKDPENSAQGNQTGPEKGEGGDMTTKGIPVSEAAKDWMKDPEFRAAYDALEEEFTVVSALIDARTKTGLTQDEVARKRGLS